MLTSFSLVFSCQFVAWLFAFVSSLEQLVLTNPARVVVGQGQPTDAVVQNEANNEANEGSQDDPGREVELEEEGAQREQDEHQEVEQWEEREANGEHEDPHEGFSEEERQGEGEAQLEREEEAQEEAAAKEGSEEETSSNDWKDQLTGGWRDFRPSTAGMSASQAAQEIEGFEEDFLLESVQGDGVEKELREGGLADEGLEKEGAGDEAEMRERLEEEKEEYERVKREHCDLQRKLASIGGALGRGVQEGFEAPRVSGDTPGERYKRLLGRWREMRREAETKAEQGRSKVDELEQRLEENDNKANELKQSLRQFRVEMCKDAEGGKGSKQVTQEKIESKEAEIERREQEISSLYLRKEDARRKLTHLEQQARRSKDFVQGVNLVDYEQLKIENQSLNEKIEERNEELANIRKKSDTTVQVLAHVKEKLQFASKDNAARETELSELDSTMSHKRHQLQNLKQECDDLRAQIANIRDFSGVITSPHLIDDVHAQRQARNELLSQLRSLRAAEPAS